MTFARSSIERALLDIERERPLPWGGVAVAVAVRLASRGEAVNGHLERRATPLEECILAREDEGFVEEDDFEATLVRESFKHGVVVDSKKFIAYASREEAARRARRRGSPARECFRDMFAPSSRAQLSWNALIVLVTAIMCFVEPLVIGFDLPMRVRAGMSALEILDVSAGVCYAIDTFVVNFLEAKVLICRSTGRRKLVTTPALIHTIYVLDDTFAEDVIICIPFVLQIIASIRQESSTVERLTRLLRMLRVFRLVGASLTTAEVLFLKITSMTPVMVFFAQTLLTTALVLHATACCYVYVAIKEGIENSWLTQMDLETASDGRIYVGALYFATTTITTVGFGDVSANNQSERLVVACSMVIGAMFFAYLVGSMTASVAGLSSRVSRQRKYRERLTRVHGFLSRTAAPSNLRRHVMSFISEVDTRRLYLHENEEVISSLPTDLREAMMLHILKPTLRRIFGNITQAVAGRIVSAFDLVVVDAGEDIPSGFFYLVTEGVIAFVHLGRPSRVAAVLTGAADGYLTYFGIDVLSPADQRQKLQASSLTVCELWRASERSIRELFTQNIDLPRSMLRNLRDVQDEDFAQLVQYRAAVLESFVARHSHARASSP